MTIHALRLQRLAERGEALFWRLYESGVPKDMAGRLASEWQMKHEGRPYYVEGIKARRRASSKRL